MRKALFRGAAIAAAVSLFTGVASAQTPDWFPEGFNLDSTAYTHRSAGDDRYQTAATIGLTQSTSTGSDGNYPFNEPDKTDPAETWGLDECPDSIGVSAGDTSADALAASPAKDLSFAGQFFSVTDVDDNTTDTFEAFMLLTNSAREGATTLNSDFVAGVNKMKAEAGCNNFDFMVFGGTEAVSSAVYDDLDAVNGTGDVYVLGGVDRNETAKIIGENVFFDSGLPELNHFPTAQSATFNTPAAADNPTTLNNVVFLAEGLTGADALTIGPVSAANNAPVFLTFTNELPSFTASALGTTDPDTIVFLGGDEAISPATRAAAAAAAPGSETSIVIGGVDRYATSVEIAEQLFGYYGENQGSTTGVSPAGMHFDNLAIGFGRSEGAGAAFVGWPDVLASAWFIDEYDDQSEVSCINACTPRRVAPDIEKNEDYLQIGNEFWGQFDIVEPDSENDTPLLVVTQGSVPSSVGSYLASLWTNSAVDICNADPDPGAESTCNNHGGFGFLFGGTSAIASSVELTIADHLAAGTYDTTDTAPTMAAGSVFYTGIDWATYTSASDGGVDDASDTAAGHKICALRNAFTGSQWLTIYETDGDHFAPNSGDAIIDYQNTGTTTTELWPRYQSRFWCESSDTVTPDDTADVFGTSLSGHETAHKAFDWLAASTRLTAGAEENAPDSEPDSFADTTDIFASVATNGGTKTATYLWSTDAPVNGTENTIPVTYKGTTTLAAEWRLEVTFTRKDPAGGADGGTTADDTDRVTFTATFRAGPAATPIFTATIVGEVASVAAPFELAGMYTDGVGGDLGGFHATVGAGTVPTGSGDEPLTDMVLDGNA